MPRFLIRISEIRNLGNTNILLALFYSFLICLMHTQKGKFLMILQVNKIKLVLLFFLLWNCSSETKKKVIGEDVVGDNVKPQNFQKIAPLTANALGERKNLHEKGWYVIPSSKKSTKVVLENGTMSFQTAKAMVFVSLKKRAEDYPGNLGIRMKKVRSFGKDEEKALQEFSKSIYSGTFNLAQWELEQSGELFKESGKSIVMGYIQLGDIEKKDREEIATTIKQFNKDRIQNYGSITELFSDVSKKNGTEISNAWSGAYKRAVDEYAKEYDESGTRPNTLVALWDIFQGYTVAVKELAFAPVTTTVVNSGKVVLINGVAVPVAYVATFLNQTIVTTGLVIYYPVKLGYRVVSPTLEAGFLSSMGILSASATAPTIVGGTAVGAFNQVATVTGVESARATGAVAGSAFESGATATGMIYDFSKGTAESVYYGLKSGIVLSYAALTVIPTHLLLSVPDATIFLAWDGPRLVIASIKGNYQGFENLPVGSIVDLEEARKKGKVEILTDDQTIVKKVLEKEIQSREEDLKREKEKK